ncbi:MAG: helix-turn-helix transcriptional regulator [Ruminococcaceae bacterium]|nr:helix-turn-helix transcriptional regulator [Oscillospiraceae bacterium]
MDYNEISKITVIASSPQFDLRVGMTVSEGGTTSQYYKHFDLHKIYYVCEGEATLETDDGSFKLKKGVLGFVGYNRTSRLINVSDDFKRVVICLYRVNKNSNMIFNLIDKEIADKNIYPVSKNFQNCIEYIMDYMKNEYDNYIPAIEYMAIPLLYEFFNITKLKFNFSYKNIEKESDDRKVKMEKYIYKNIYRKISAEEVAKYMNMSLRQLNRILNNTCGWTVKHQIDGMKYNEAKKILVNTKLNLVEISSKLGFSSEHSFITFFKRMSGITPKNYRENHMKPDFDLSSTERRKYVPKE